jgi:hypothetical protein
MRVRRHTNNAEYVNISSIEPRLYVLTRLIMDIAGGKAGVSAPAVRAAVVRNSRPRLLVTGSE